MTGPTFKRTPARRGECFHNVFHFMLANPTWEAVHGIPLGQGQIAGLRYGHAWVEVEHDGVRWVFDPSTDLLIHAAVYYAIGDINYVRRYSAEEVAINALHTGHSGPWDDTINRAAGRKPARKNRKHRATKET